ncbi:hypothetical protein [Neptuniibacter halophilus]|uniref:hypothetical protein n=1 Tax=Neptuniibacter halophilus TaxID=651666 RepID=UPI00257473A2|nr:hypothetical protein [Neptuniibacter halophilus]
MKYLIFSVQKAGQLIEIPFLFPDNFTHRTIASVLTKGGAKWQIVAAGSCQARVNCYGKSEELGIESRERVDAAIINEFAYRQGVVDPDQLTINELLNRS